MHWAVVNPSSVCAAQGLTGAVTIATLGGDFPMLAGNVVAIALSAIVCIVVSLIKPQNFDWAVMKEIPMVEHDEAAYAETGAVSNTRYPVVCVLGLACLYKAPLGTTKHLFKPSVQ